MDFVVWTDITQGIEIAVELEELVETIYMSVGEWND